MTGAKTSISISDREPTGAARSVVREIDRELSRLDNIEKAAAAERALLLAARAALCADGRAGSNLRRRVTQREIAAYLGRRPGSSAAQVAEALQAAPTVVSAHLHRGKHTRYESNSERWYLRPRSN
jgi:hypothetical protein